MRIMCKNAFLCISYKKKIVEQSISKRENNVQVVAFK